MLKNCISSNELFIDENFTKEKIECYLMNEFNLKDLKLIRPYNFYNFDNFNSLKLFNDNFSLQFYKKGFVNNQKLLFEINKVNKFPKILKKVFNYHKINPFGIYSLNFIFNGIINEIIIDDFIPCINNESILGFQTNEEIWFILLCKAFCKIFGTFLLNNNKNFFLEYLVGSPKKGYNIFLYYIH